MSFKAELKNIFVYPKMGNTRSYMAYAIVEQSPNDPIKVIYKGSLDDMILLMSHPGPIRFQIKGVPKNGFYKNQNIQMYDVEQIQAIVADNQPAITNHVEHAAPSVVFE